MLPSNKKTQQSQHRGTSLKRQEQRISAEHESATRTRKRKNTHDMSTAHSQVDRIFVEDTINSALLNQASVQPQQQLKTQEREQEDHFYLDLLGEIMDTSKIESEESETKDQASDDLSKNTQQSNSPHRFKYTLSALTTAAVLALLVLYLKRDPKKPTNYLQDISKIRKQLSDLEIYVLKPHLDSAESVLKQLKGHSGSEADKKRLLEEAAKHQLKCYQEISEFSKTHPALKIPFLKDAAASVSSKGWLATIGGLFSASGGSSGTRNRRSGGGSSQKRRVIAHHRRCVSRKRRGR
jgi:hypothetical protein